MRNGMRPPLRGGFTLIELLVVIAILGALVALTVGIIGSVRTGQQKSTTEGTVKKLQVGLNQLRTAVIDEATSDKNPYLPVVQQWCDNDKDRAKAVLSYLYMKREFPQTFAEARMNLGAGVVSAGGIPPHRAFVDLPAGNFSAEQEAAVLLHKIVNGKANRGTSIDPDGSFAGAEFVVPGPNVTGYKDGFGAYVIFQRFADSNETNAAPYARQLGSLPNHYDTLDPTGKLRNWRLPNGSMHPNLLLLINHLNLNAGMSRLPLQGGLDGHNRMLTVISAGMDRNADPNDPAGQPWHGSNPDGWLGGDNVLGFRLAQLGARGN
jgi:prepilin-type N-terminal cleavage/methylation domain-containing protein